MNIHKKNYIIISSHNPEYTKQYNARIQGKLLEALINLVGFDSSIHMTSGRYNGIDEESYAVVMPNTSSKLWHKLCNGLMGLSLDYSSKDSGLLCVRNDIDVPEAFFFPAGKSTPVKYTWVEVDDSIKDTDEPYTLVQGKYFSADNAQDTDYIWIFEDHASLKDCLPKDFDCTYNCQTGIECSDCDQKI